MSALSELEALRDGLTSPFWEVFQRHVQQEWGPSGLSFQAMYREGIETKNWEKVVAANEIQKAMAEVLLWPVNRVNHLKSQGLRELVEIRSRGGL